MQCELELHTLDLGDSLVVVNGHSRRFADIAEYEFIIDVEILAADGLGHAKDAQASVTPSHAGKQQRTGHEHVGGDRKWGSLQLFFCVTNMDWLVVVEDPSSYTVA